MGRFELSLRRGFDAGNGCMKLRFALVFGVVGGCCQLHYIGVMVPHFHMQAAAGLQRDICAGSPLASG